MGTFGKAVLKNLAHGLSQAAVAQSKGKNATPTFYSGFLASGLSVGNKGYGGLIPRTLIASAVGGTSSSVAGGKFANGAVTGAFVHLFKCGV